MNTQVNDPKGAAGALKAPMHLIPPYALEQTAWVHKLGSEKYGPYNWRKTGVCATTYVSAIIRHLDAWRDGQNMDPESGISHIAHIVSSCNILLDAGHCGTLQDDRNKKPVPNTFASVSANAAADAVKRASVALDQRDLPIPSEWTLPPVPEGYDRWVYRGTFKFKEIIAKNRFIVYSFMGDCWTKACHFSTSNHHLEAVKGASVAMDQRDLPIPSGWNLPPVPKGYDRWVYRGTFRGRTIDAEDRHVLYNFEEKWHKTMYFSGGCHHIEAIKDESVAPGGLLPFPPVPKGYDHWVYRGKGWSPGHRVSCFAAVTIPESWEVYEDCHASGYQHAYYIEAVKDESVAPDGLLPFPPVPKGYDRWVYRGRGWSSDKPTKYAYRWPHDKQWNCAKGTAPVGYEDTHYIEAVK